MNAKEVKDKVAEHWHEHKEAYIAGGAGIAAGMIVVLVVGQKSAYARNLIVQGINIKSPSTNVINNQLTVTRAPKGPLGNAVIRLSDNEQYRSLREAALKNGMSEYKVRSKIRDGEMFRILREAKWVEPSQE